MNSNSAAGGSNGGAYRNLDANRLCIWPAKPSVPPYTLRPTDSCLNALALVRLLS